MSSNGYDFKREAQSLSDSRDHYKRLAEGKDEIIRKQRQEITRLTGAGRVEGGRRKMEVRICEGVSDADLRALGKGGLRKLLAGSKVPAPNAIYLEEIRKVQRGEKIRVFKEDGTFLSEETVAGHMPGHGVVTLIFSPRRRTALSGGIDFVVGYNRDEDGE